ncbi:MAG: methyltransferase domain-containing protein [Thermodesulfobacteriota bacterium]|nr:methyltransferase domain-containing protein [Thermodesulfobacteriota bacterium]
MTRRVMEFITRLNLKGKILDVGSRDINGCVRPLYEDYIGVDMVYGRNVDIIAKSDNLPFMPNHFDNVVCLEMLEHDDSFWISIPEMIRVLKPGGKLVVTARGIHFHKHNYPYDYWRFTRESFELLFRGLNDVYVTEETGDNGVYGYGTKK